MPRGPTRVVKEVTKGPLVFDGQALRPNGEPLPRLISSFC